MKFDSIPRRVKGSIGSTVHYLPAVPSTNDYLLALDEAPEGLTVVTDLQTAGRGRGSNRWEAPAVENLLFSFVTVLDAPGAALPLLPLLTALGVCEGLDDMGIGGSVTKWPNDLLMRGRKLCGILIETRVQGRVARTVTGVGLNVNQTTFPAALSDHATSLALETKKTLDRELVLGRVLDSLNRVIFHDDIGSAVGRYAARCTTIGEEVGFEFEGRPRRGTATAIDESGRLLIEEGGRTTAFFGSEVTHVRPLH